MGQALAVLIAVGFVVYMKVFGYTPGRKDH